ncbi:Multidrug export protein EmrB [compost metagenome]
MATIAQAGTQAPAVNPWIATITLMVGTLAAVMGSSTINTALPDIMSGLAISQDQVSWVATAYMLANVIAIPSAAWLGALLSQRLLFGLGAVIFLVGSILCGVSWDFSSMIAFRVIQGLGAGLIMPTGQTLMLQIFPPHQRGQAMGIFGMGVIMGPAIGPTVGGYLVSLFGWRSIFFINLPFAILSLLMLNTLPRAERGRDLPFDAPGFISMVIFLTGLQIGVSNGAKDGWTAPYIMGCFAASALAFAFLIYHELTTDKPLLDLRVFKNGAYNAATLVSMVVGLGLFGSTFLVPVFLGNMLGYSALQIGLVLLPGSLLMGVMMLVSGKLSDLIDGRILVAVGLMIYVVGIYTQSLADIGSPEQFYMWAQVWRGLGMGLVFSPLTAIALAKVPPAQIAQASGLFNLTRQLSGSIGIAALNTVLISRTAHHASTLGEGMSAQSSATQAFLSQAQQSLVARGMAPDQASLGAFTLLGGAVRQQVTVMAFADLFLILTAATLLGLVSLSMVPKPNRKIR